MTTSIVITSTVITLTPPVLAIVLPEIVVFFLAGLLFSYLFRCSHPHPVLMVTYLTGWVVGTVLIHLYGNPPRLLQYDKGALTILAIALQHLTPGAFLLGLFIWNKHKKYPVHGKENIIPALNDKNKYADLNDVVDTFFNKLREQLGNAPLPCSPQEVAQLLELELRSISDQLGSENTTTKISKDGLDVLLSLFPTMCSRIFTHQDLAARAFQIASLRQKRIMNTTE